VITPMVGRPAVPSARMRSSGAGTVVVCARIALGTHNSAIAPNIKRTRDLRAGENTSTGLRNDETPINSPRGIWRMNSAHPTFGAENVPVNCCVHTATRNPYAFLHQ